MGFDKEAYWKAKKDNIGSKRPKPTFIEFAGKHLLQLGGKLIMVNRAQYRMKPADIRNTKKHRDDRSLTINKIEVTSARIKRKEAGEKQRIMKKK